ncbi:PAS domain-containing protein [Thermoanaerobacterium sp. RBIITD]|uniref:helix-turn-helix transcriptional regulator n=1 Tax=Thermoanaerobacterium sp. RBIITD TaxID=1550240 RepID=UPI000BB71B31|nr:PAS domain-containing protein [Thermoanaerobacterium sp. RBIITD]SNX55166.1 Predicted transcriptional regulator YheO, contains PAS and DNA-binding HTH domains [Thermoanaerobacterium sp. RBIITD]
MPSKTHPILKNMIPVVESIAKTFGKNCEVVLYDFSNLQSSVIAVGNGHITGREVGNPIPEIILKALKSNKTDNEVNFKSKGKDGKILKSTTVYFKDDSGRPIGCLCINIDISEYIMVKNTLQDLCEINDGEELSAEPYSGNVNDVLENIVNTTIENYGKPVNFMSKEEKVNMVKMLDAKGTFLIRGAIDYVAKILCVSRYTIYNYLDEIRVGDDLSKY